MPLKFNKDKAAVVNTETFWIEITETNKPVTGARYQLIRKDAGVAQIAPFRDDGWYTHYAGLPKFRTVENHSDETPSKKDDHA
jgi:hypothetical protein